MIKLLASDEDGSTEKSQLFSNFGEKEYSILNAIGSTRKQTRMSALKALVGTDDFVSTLNDNEKALVKMAILQTLSSTSFMEEDILLLSLNALGKLGDGGSQDLDFECLSTLLGHISLAHVTYSSVATEQITHMAADLAVTSEKNHCA